MAEDAKTTRGALSQRVGRVAPSPTLKMSAEAKAMKARGVDVIDLSVGEPDFPTPQNIKKAADEAIRQDFTRYTANKGIPELRKAIAARLKADTGADYDSEDILVSAGAKSSLFHFFAAVLDPGDEVIIPAPYWVSYPAQVLLFDGTPVTVETKEKNGFRMTADEFRSALTPRTKAVILNNPSNPTGAAYTKSDLEPLARLAAKENIFLVADEIYDKLVYDDFRFTSVASLGPEVREWTLLVNGVSKSYAMTGWRIGFAAGPTKLIGAMARIQSHSTSNATSISQKAALEAYRGPQEEVEKMRREFERRRDVMLERVRAIPGVTCPEPQGAFYLFPNLSAYIGKKHAGGPVRDSTELANYLLQEAHVAVVQGSAFGAEGYIRLSYSTSMKEIEEAMRRIAVALANLR